MFRGLTFDKFINCELWWHNPSFLKVADITSNKSNDLQHVEETNEFSSEITHKTDTTLVSLNSTEFVDHILNISNICIKILRI